MPNYHKIRIVSILMGGPEPPFAGITGKHPLAGGYPRPLTSREDRSGLQPVHFELDQVQDDVREPLRDV